MNLKKIQKHILFILSTLLFYSCCTFSSPPYKGPVSDHFDGKRFVNTYSVDDEDTLRGGAVSNFLRWRLRTISPGWSVKPDERQGPKPPDRVYGDSLRITYIGHSTVLLQFDGLNVITDPVFSSMVGPVTYIGHTRKRIPGLKLDDLPPIDVVLISHNHYDHMDKRSLQKINEKHKPYFIAPLGNKALLAEFGIANVYEMDWHDSIEFKDHTFYMTPATHFSMRGLCDRNTSLWAGFVIETSGGPIFFAGDTGYGSHFKELNDKFPPFRLSMLPIAPIEPRNFMKDVHASPSDAVRAHIELDSRLSIPIHFSTFKQGNDEQAAPVWDLVKSINKAKVNPDEWMMPAHGKGVEIPPLRQ